MEGFGRDFGRAFGIPALSRPNPLKDPRDSRKVLSPDDLARVAGDLHSVAIRASFKIQIFRVPSRFWSDFGRVLEAKMDAKIDVFEFCRRCFFRTRFDIDFLLFFGEPNPEKSIRTIGFSMVLANFQ